MSIKLMAQLWDNAKTLSGNRLLVMLCLADHANDDGICWPSTQRIAIRCRISKRQVIRIISDLEAQKWLKIKKGDGTPNIYTINVTGDIAMSPVGGDIAMSPVQNVTGDILNVTGDIAMSPGSDIAMSPPTGDIAMSPEPPLLEPSGTTNLKTTTTTARGGGGGVFLTYRQNIGPLSTQVAEWIKIAVEEFGESTVEDAIKIATSNNVRKWSYVAGILARRRGNGRSQPKPVKGKEVVVLFNDPFGGEPTEEIMSI